MEENFFDTDEFFDPNFINNSILLDEICPIVPQSFPEILPEKNCDGIITRNSNQPMINSWDSLSSPTHVQEMTHNTITIPSSSSPSQFVSFEAPIIDSSLNSISYSFHEPQVEFNPPHVYYGHSNPATAILTEAPQVLNFSSSPMTLDDIGNIDLHDGIVNSSNASGISLNVGKTRAGPMRNPLQTKEHIIAERKRREKLSQLFISLSKTVPGIKKLDKGSLLQHAIDYTKTLQERVSELEKEQAAALQNNSNTVESSSSTSKENSLDDNGVKEESEAFATEIKARISDKNVLVSIWIKKQKGFIPKIHSEMEKLGLNVVDVRVMPFAEIALYATILAEMPSEFQGAEKDIVAQLKMAFLDN